MCFYIYKTDKDYSICGERVTTQIVSCDRKQSKIIQMNSNNSIALQNLELFTPSIDYELVRLT